MRRLEPALQTQAKQCRYFLTAKHNSGSSSGGNFVFVFIYLPHDYNNYKEMPKKCRKKWRGGLKETIELMLIRPPQLQFFEDGMKLKITATDTK